MDKEDDIMDRSFWRQCGSKNRYRDEHTVNYYKRMYERERGQKLDYYWCTHCKGFHLTSTAFKPKYYDYDELYNEEVAVG